MRWIAGVLDVLIIVAVVVGVPAAAAGEADRSMGLLLIAVCLGRLRDMIAAHLLGRRIDMLEAREEADGQPPVT